ncbi:MAG: glycine cleavage system aminomethyltransferase GcvT [Actinobacteria bacterium]|nr:glycine cleavage system aminomethyltransferase GcvT [Actinomycetota bacterium]
MSVESELRRTPLYDLHLAAGAKMVEFGGWLMPVQYAGIIAEHKKVREAAGIFDLSHMGRVYVGGGDAERFLQMLATNDLSKLAVGQVQYSLICNREGGVRDDILAYRLGDGEYLLVVNASNRPKILGWMDEVLSDLRSRARSVQVTITDRTLETAMVGVQGPSSMALLQPLTDLPLAGIGYYHGAPARVIGVEGYISRTGYTGEDGFEVILPGGASRQLWQRLEQAAPAVGGALCGLGARDTLRLEAGMPLYGHELGEGVNPFEVGLDRYVHPDKPELVGRDALLTIAAAGPRRRLVGLEVTDRAIARQGTPVVAGGGEVGRVTSGSFSPTLDRSIAMALVTPEVASERPPLEVSVRGAAHPASIVNLPFYRRRRK